MKPIPLSISPLKGEKPDFTLPFKGRAGVGMGLQAVRCTDNYETVNNCFVVILSVFGVKYVRT